MTAGSPSRLMPKLRFAEFRDDTTWLAPQLADLYAFKRTNTLSRDKLNYEAGTIRNIHYGDIHTKFKPLFRVGDEYVPYVNPDASPTGFDDDAFCEEGDIVLADASEDLDDVGKAIEVVSLDGERVVAGMHTILATRRGGVPVVCFGGQLFQSAAVRAGIKKEAQGAKVYGISANRISAVPVPIPPTAAEQQKVADCLGSLDDLIAAEGRKLEALRQHKQGLMQQLFPQPGETVPRLRFPEFEDAPQWEKPSLGEVCEMKAGDFVGASKIFDVQKDGFFPCYGGNGLRGFVKTATHDGLYVLVGRQGALCGNVNLFAGCFHATEHALVATPSSGIDTHWLYYALDMLKLNRFATGQAQPGLSVGVLNAVPVAVPANHDEQRRIADCLAALDDYIAAQANRLETIKCHKQGLLQQLFPSLQEES